VPSEIQHVTVCICTYKRPQLLKGLLAELERQDTDGLFTYSVVVSDNDRLRSAEATVLSVTASSNMLIRYCVEPRQNIALARNEAVKNATGDFVAFLDDDEFPAKRWLVTLFKTCQDYGVEGVLGPVKRHFVDMPPKWVVKGGFYERPTYSTGFVIDWSKGRTNNVLIRRRIMLDDPQPFRPEFRTGEDQDFFRRMIDKGHVFVWCDEAIVYEIVPPIRWKRTFMLRRALLQGTSSVLHPNFGAREIAKSIIAIPVYTAVLPLALIFAHAKFMSVLLKLCDHIGKLLAVLKINPIKAPYVTD
jgi:succinoglycan biosynthesis protein ExoM